MLHIHLFGHLRLLLDGRPFQFAGIPKVLPLWAYLLLNRDEPVPRDRLAYLLWPDTSERRARANLRRHLHHLRQALPPEVEDVGWVLGEGGTVQWNPAAAYWLDVAEFERLSGSPDHLARAVELYGGDLLPELYEDWIALERERLRELYLADLVQLATRSRARGEHGQALAYVQRILGSDALHEDAVRDLMRLCCRAGDRAGAVQAYQSFERRLEEELGVAPMAETRALYEAVVEGAPLPEEPAAEAVELAPAACPHNLPAQLNAFFGREADLIALRHLLRLGDARVRLVTLSGPAGVGKTRLALEVATRLLPGQAGTFPDGIFFVDLFPLGDPALVIPALAGTLGVKESGEQSLLEGLKGLLRSRYVLLVLDNFEHVIEAGPLVAELLAAAPNLRVLVTSRAVLRVYGEHEYALAPLPLPDLEGVLTVEELGENPAVALFVGRARERWPAFALTEENAAAVAEICVCLDGLPLAIELAASRVKVLSPAEMLARLSDRLAFLEEGPRDRPARHQALRAAIAWSHDLLEEDERALFAALGVFAGGCTLGAAEAVCDSLCGEDVANGLSSLVDRSLIYRFEEGDEPRFGMLASIREYALEQLVKQGQLDMMCRHHADYYASLAERARAEESGPDQAAWMTRLGAEADNLRAVLSWALDDAADAPRIVLGATLCRALHILFWKVGGQLSEGRDWCERALIHGEQLPPELRIYLLNNTGWLAQLQGDYQAANIYYQEALALARQPGATEALGVTLHSLGTLAGRQGDYERAETLLTEAIGVEREAHPGEASPNLYAVLNNLAIVLKHLGDYERAAALLREGLEITRARGDHLATASCLCNLGNLALAQQDYVNAEAYLRESLLLRQLLGDRIGTLPPLSCLAELALASGEAARSVCLYSVGNRFRQEFGLVRSPENRREEDRFLALLRERLGEIGFAGAWARGQELTLDQAVAYALSAGESP